MQPDVPTCIVFLSLLNYFQLTNYFWMFVEGNLIRSVDITISDFESRHSFLLFFVSNNFIRDLEII